MVKSDTANAGEKAIAVCNYLKFLKQRVMIVVGMDQSRSRCYAIHLTDQHGKTSILDPLSGSISSTSDPHCTLREVYLVFDEENVWANLQANLSLSVTTWDVAAISRWRRLFPTSGFTLTRNIQTDIVYDSIGDMSHATQELNQGIMNFVEDIRTSHVTKWNRNCSKLLQLILPQMEQREQGETINIEASGAFSELMMLTKSHQLSGFIRCFDDLESAKQALAKSGLLETDTNSAIEFGCAIHLVPLYHAFWLGIAAISKGSKS
jgi:hypothetical protein